MGFSGRLGSEMARFCCDPDRADTRRTSAFSVRVLTGSTPDGVGKGAISSFGLDALSSNPSTSVKLISFKLLMYD